MKTFLNVLYRRILYKIPLKFLLLGLAIFGILFSCFSNADSVGSLLTVSTINVSSVGTSYKTFLYAGDVISEDSTICFKISTENIPYDGFRIGSSNGTNVDPYNYLNYYKQVVLDGNYVCFALGPLNYLRVLSRSSGTYNISIDYFVLNGFLGLDLPLMTSLQCQTEYNLIPIESVDSNYCQSNNLCPSCPVCPSVPVGTGGYSQLYINNILHLGAPNIIMNIPDEIDWDYAYTQGGQNMNIDVVGYNVDYEKIDSIVQFQNYKPSSEDFQRIISLLAPYTKIIVFFVFLFIIWAWIKKPFKSKKL